MPRYADVAIFPHRVPLIKRFPETYTYLIPEDWPELFRRAHSSLRRLARRVIWSGWCPASSCGSPLSRPIFPA